ncbi:hypothetical protein T03_10917 [Trichinella britovi]|uniref:Uncharacterized protein n=1 Tax=Trichinella britovi TaxID=45882 RepID=A0A0V1CIY4_TRIBR|nr:hypothetical protein T03_10917 [Trichinella britovi]
MHSTNYNELRNENKWKRLIVRIPLVVDVAVCALLQSAQTQTCGGVFCLSEFFCYGVFCPINSSLFINMKIISSQLTVRVLLWKRPFVRIPLKVDMVVCALLQSEQTGTPEYASLYEEWNK